ncbi:hypothetical protein BC937DRAFT_87457 [Endogone sp. FLAS-F59071]|nr:hypothetical protein BC937DRAFT_87457 [Endogone sp. FLAS-F59071]|eukprot:RUS19443.1 hypothetical protein BC937DRAFT_87457 [Endogone sp. FLAS-F59071]
MGDNNDQEQSTDTPEYVKLISCDGFEFIVNREVALRSGTIKNMLSSPGQFTESVQNEVVFRDIKAIILETICRYLYYNWQNTNSTTEIPEFKIEPELALETLMAADFLDSIPRATAFRRISSKSPTDGADPTSGSPSAIFDLFASAIEKTNLGSAGNKIAPDSIDISSSLTPRSQTGSPAVYNLHIVSSVNNTILTLTSPDGSRLIMTSGGTAGFKKAARGGYEAAHQAATQLLQKVSEKNLQVGNVHLVLKGFGPGRDAAFKAIVAGGEWGIRRITDATPMPFNGCRPKKARRL